RTVPSRVRSHLLTRSSPPRPRLLTFFFFFFQAEDGIRDPLVTGVQTCALPISVYARARRFDRGVQGEQVGLVRDESDRLGELLRSEERRVGKECRSRWSP